MNQKFEGADFSFIIENCDAVYVKKLSNNDRDWARYKNKHQAGVYVSPVQRDSGFFPNLCLKVRNSKEDAEIRETFFPTIWPQYGSSKKKTRLVHYTSKGPETHLTGVLKAAFADLSPASFFVMGRITTNGEYSYICLTVDSNSDDALILADIFDFGADFLVEIFRPKDLKRKSTDKILDFAEEVIRAWLSGAIKTFSTDVAAMPQTQVMANLARKKYLDSNKLARLDPFSVNAPGDALREISRIIEWELFKDFQKKERAVALVRLLFGDEPKIVDAGSAIRTLVNNFAEIDRLMLSASQQRKSRAGYSFEHHIEYLLIDGNVPFEKQVVIESKKRPDFVLPTITTLRKPKQGQPKGLILSAKTTLRERWKQVEREMGDGELCLATVDESIAGNAISEMASMGILLVVPESLKKSKETEYSGHSNVLSFKEFFTDIISPRLSGWRQPLTPPGS